MPYPRFSKVIIHHFLSKHNSIPKRHSSIINTIKDDGVLGKLKFVSKDEDDQKYRISILDLMMNDEIKNFDASLTYLALSTNTEPPKVAKGKGKAEDNIIPDPEEALKLGKSIILTKAEEQDEQKRFHETHERLVTEKTTSDEKFDDEEEGIQIKSEAAQLASDMQKETKASRRAYRIQQDPKGSSEGSGVNPEGSKGEVETLSSDDDKTESDKEKAKSEKANDEIANEEQTYAEHDDEVKVKEEVANKEIVDEEIADDAKDNEEITDTDKVDEEMVDVEKVNVEKTKEEKVDEKQTGDDQADKDDQAKDVHVEDNQATAVISVTQKEKPELPPSSSSLSFSSDYVIPEQPTSTPTTPPTITEAEATLVAETDPSSTVLQSLLELEKKVTEMSNVNHAVVIEKSGQANVLNEVINQIPKFLPKAVSEFVEPRLERTVRDVLKTNPINLV
ncbi:hypothetical protein Tco_1503869 [Tanacetum coccineum]